MADSAADIKPASYADDAALYCPSCMYDLRGLTGEQCPECGMKLDRHNLANASIPWVYRDGLGLGAFLKTMMRATFKTQLFCHDVARPVSLAHARAFRRMVVWLLCVVIILTATGYAVVMEDVRDLADVIWQQQPLLLIVLALLPVVLLWLFLHAFTGLHTYWFHPQKLLAEQQNRAVAISHYACAPLVWLAPAVVVFGIANLIGVIGDSYDIDPLVWIAVVILMISCVVMLLSLIAYLFVCAHMARYAAQRSDLARVAIWFALPPLWLGLIILIFGALPLIGLYLLLVLTSF